MKIMLVHSGKAFLPEMYAYQGYLQGKGHKVSVVADDEVKVRELPDLYYRFAGYLRHRLSANVPEIHEYASASIGAFPRFKNLVKSVASTRPVGRVFLSPFVKDEFSFSEKVPFIFRDMGASKDFFEQRGSGGKVYDLVYAGSISGRAGVLDCIVRLADVGLRIGLAGMLTDNELAIVRRRPLIDYVGKLHAEDVPQFIAKARFGLNICPDIYPFNQQTSTKVIEYLAAGIGIVSNRYRWIEEHSARHGYSFLDVSEISAASQLVERTSAVLDRECTRQFEWTELFERVGFEAFLRRCVDINDAEYRQ